MLPRLSGPRRSLSAMGCTQRSGPSTVEELDTWPLDIVVTLLQAGMPGEASRVRRLRDLFVKKFKLSGDYSGMECSREVARLLKIALRPLNLGLDFDWEWVRSCDYSKQQQEYLVTFSQMVEDSNGCVLCDINDRLTAEAAKVLNEHEPAKDLSYLMKKQAYARMLDYLLAGGERCYLTEVPCVVHGKPCVAHPGHQADFDDESEQCWNFAGTTCTGWSAVGKGNLDVVFQCVSVVTHLNTGEGHADGSERPHAVWLGERAHLAKSGKETGFFGECTPRYPVKTKLREPLRSSHRVIFVLVNPKVQGASCACVCVCVCACVCVCVCVCVLWNV